MPESNENISKEELLAKSRIVHQALVKALDLFPRDQFSSCDLGNGWSCKDVLAHITAWEQRMIHTIKSILVGEKLDLMQGGKAVDEFNANIYTQNKDVSPEDIIRAFDESYRDACDLIESIQEDVLANRGLIPGSKEPLWVMAAANMWWHYQEHLEMVENWRSQQS